MTQLCSGGDSSRGSAAAAGFERLRGMDGAVNARCELVRKNSAENKSEHEYDAT